MTDSSLCRAYLRALCLTVALSGLLQGQTPTNVPWEGPAFSAEPKDIIAAAAAVKPQQYAALTVLTEERRVVFDSDQRIVTTARIVYRVESKGALPGWGTVKATWSPWRQARPLIRARVIQPDGTVATLDPSVLTEAAAHDQRPVIYEDQRSYSGPLPAVGIGSIVETETTYRDTAPVSSHGMMRRFIIGYRVPTLHTLLQIQAPLSVHIRYKIRRAPGVVVTRTEQAGVLTLRFEHGFLDALEATESDLPSDFEDHPAIDYSTGESWNAVAEGYYRDIESAVRPNEAAPILEGTSGLKGQELLRRIVTNLHQKVRYTGLEFGASALIPHPAGDTLKSGYGDCKDKAVVLVSALKAAGLQAHLALLTTRSDEDISPDLAGVGMFNHAIVYVSGKPGTWIDATAEFLGPGDLPWSDQGRLALVVGLGTTTLVKTPVNTPQENIERFRREFYLSESGPAHIVEVIAPVGTVSGVLRSGYGESETKEGREGLESYAKRMFLAESLTSVEHTPGADLTKPFELRLDIARGRRGLSDLTQAVVAIRNDGLLWGYPNYVLSDDGTDKPDKPGWKARRNDIEVQPFATEWHYRIVPPPGFDAPVLPKDSEQSLGPGKLTQHYEVEKDGAVAAVWRFDSAKARYSPSELKALQQAAHALGNTSAVLIVFPQKGAALLSQGRAREALSSYAELTRLHPTEALHHIQIANALLVAGFGDEARKEAVHATELDAKSALAWSSLGWIRQHDAIGRRFGRGFDLNGAVSAYRRAIELDPKEWSYHADLAILLEHDTLGERYSPESRLDEAAAEYRKLKEVNKEKAEGYDDNLLFVLSYQQKWDDVLQFCASLPKSRTRDGIALAAIAARDGSKSALTEAARRESDETSRSNILVSAANLLIRLRAYPTALDLMNAAAAGQEDSSRLRGRIELLQAVHPYEKAMLPESDPRSVVQRFYLYLLDPRAKPDEMFRYTESDPGDQKSEAEAAARSARVLRTSLEGRDMTLAMARDLILSSLQLALEGDDQSGFRIRARGFGDKPQSMLVARGPAGYRIVALDSDVAMAGAEVLRRLDSKDSKGAKLWLDWAREQQTLNPGDDPLGGAVFPRFWTRGDEADPPRMRLAALALLANSSAIRGYLDELNSRRTQAKEADSVRLDLLLAHAASKLRDFGLLHEVAPRLLAASPGSDTALRFVVTASIFTSDWRLGQEAVAARLARIPDDLTAIRLSAQLVEGKGDFAGARKILRPVIDGNRAEMNDFNQYTWNALFVGKVTDEDVSILQRAIAAKPQSSYAEIHTLACLYAEIGKTKEARELLLRAMDSGGFDEPNEPIWYGFGRIAEEYDLPAIALSLYQRVGKTPDADLPTSTYNLARRREKLLQSNLKPSPSDSATAK